MTRLLVSSDSALELVAARVRQDAVRHAFRVDRLVDTGRVDDTRVLEQLQRCDLRIHLTCETPVPWYLGKKLPGPDYDGSPVVYIISSTGSALSGEPGVVHICTRDIGESARRLLREIHPQRGQYRRFHAEARRETRSPESRHPYLRLLE